MEKIPLKTTLKRLMARTFINPSVLPKNITIYILILELFIFSAIIHLECLQDAIEYFPSSPYTAVLINVGILAVRIITGAPIIKPLYFICVLISPQIFGQTKTQNQVTIALYWLNLILLAVNMLIDALSHVDFSFQSENPYSETHNFNKILHNIGILGISVILIQYHRKDLNQGITDIAIHSSSTAIFILLAICKIRSQCKNSIIKNVLIRFYFLCAFFDLAKIIIALTSVQIPYLVEKVVVIASSQIFLSFLQNKCLRNEISNLTLQFHSEERICGFLLQLLSWKFGPNCDENIRQVFMEFMAAQRSPKVVSGNQQVDIENIKQKKIQKTGPKETKRQENIKSLSYAEELQNKIQQENQNIFETFKKVIEEKMQQWKMQNNNNQIVLLGIILAQLLEVGKKQVFVAKYILEVAKQDCPREQLLQKICIYKEELRINRVMKWDKKYKSNLDHNMHLINEIFLAELINSSDQYLKLWRYLQGTRVEDTKVMSLLSKVASSRFKIQELYQSLPSVRSKQVLQTYLQYLYQVERDLEKANKVLRNVKIFPENLYEAKISDKIYVKILLSTDRFLILDRVGREIQKLLGYSSENVKGSNISILLPEFYRNTHQTLIKQKVFRMSAEELLVFNKSVIARHSEGHYLPCMVRLKLNIKDDGVPFMEGFMQPLIDSKYKWKSFFFIRQPDGMIDMGSCLQEQIDYKAEDQPNYTDYLLNYNPLQPGLKYQETKKFMITPAGLHKEFHLLTELEVADEKTDKYQYFVQHSNHSQIEITWIAKELIYEAYPKELPYYNYENNSKAEEDYFIKKEIILSKNTPLTMKRLILGVFFTAFAIFGLEIFINVLNKNVDEREDQIEEDFRQIVQQYNGVSFTTISENSFRIETMYNFSPYQRHQQNEYEPLSIKLGISNAYLEKYSKERYGLNGPKSALISNKTATQLVSLMISNFNEYMYLRFEPQLSLKLFEFFHRILITYYDGASQQFMEAFRTQMRAERDDKGEKRTIICSLMGLMALFGFLLMVFIRYLQISEQNKIFQAILSLSEISPNLKDRCQNFITKFTGEKESGIHYSRFIQEPQRDEGRQEKTQRVEQIQELQVSYIGPFTVPENSNRELINSSIISSRNLAKRIERNSKLHKGEENEEPKKQRMNVRISKKYISFWLVFFLMTILFPFIQLIIVTSSNHIFLQKSLLNVITVFNKYEVISNVLSLHLDSMSYPESRELLLRNMQKIDMILDEKTEFPQVQNSYFVNFSEALKSIEYDSICNYVKCEEKFKESVNLDMALLMKKVKQYIINHTDNSDVLNKSFQLQAICYSFDVIGKAVNYFVEVFLQDLQKYQSYDQEVKLTLDCLQFFFNFVLIVLVIIFYWTDVVAKIRRNSKILQILRKQDYRVVEKEEIQ